MVGSSCFFPSQRYISKYTKQFFKKLINEIYEKRHDTLLKNNLLKNWRPLLLLNIDNKNT